MTTMPSTAGTGSAVPSSPVNRDTTTPQHAMVNEGQIGTIRTSRTTTTTLVGGTTGIEESSPGDLLREWQYPPVAPAVVVGEVTPPGITPPGEQELPRPPSAVATFVPFVRDFVRTSMDQIYQQDQRAATTATSATTTTSAHANDATQRAAVTRNQGTAAAASGGGGDMAVLSVRSEADAQGFIPVLSPDLANSQAPTTTASARTVHDIMHEEAEFILVDGDLIALPPRRGEEGTDDNMQLLNHHKPCRPSRMRRGVRKIGKWFGRNKKKNQRSSSKEVSPNASGHLTVSGDRSHIADSEGTRDINSVSSGVNPRTMTRQSSLGDRSSHSAGGGGGGGRRAGKNKKKDHPRRSRRQRAASDDQLQQLQQQMEVADTGLLSAAELQAQREQLTGVLPPQPERSPLNAATSSGPESVMATPVGTEEQLRQAGEMPPAAEAFVEIEFYDDDGKNEKEKNDIPASMVPAEADIKVDKGEAPDVQAMLVRAEHETTTDLDPAPELEGPAPRPKGKSDGSSVPLSQAHRSDKHVHNDMLKVLLVGSVGPAKSALARAIRESQKKPRTRTTLGLDVHTWSDSGINFQIWNVQGSTTAAFNESAPNFGAHPSTQSLFFSDEALYLLVWDLACHNSHTFPVFDYDSDEEDEHANDFTKEQAIAEADRALQEDISTRVLSWVDRIASRAPRSAVLPVAIIPDGMEEEQVERRCAKMFEMLENHVKWKEGNESMPNIVLDCSRNVLSVNYSQNFGIKQIQKTMVAIATDSSRSLFEHVGTPVPDGAVEIMEYTRSMKRQHRLIRLDHVLGAVGDSVPVEQAVRALHFLASVGEVLYFGTEHDDVLSSFIILSRQWLVSALSCILRNDLKRELADARKFMNMQCIYSEQKFHENEIVKALSGGGASSCPLLTDEDAVMLWRSMSFMREAADRYSQMNENSTDSPTIFYFLQRLLEHFGIFMKFGHLNQSDSAGLDKHSEVFFVPSLLSQSDPGDIWCYRAPESWSTTLCHSWLFRDGTPPDLFEFVAVSLLRDLYEFSREFAGSHKDQLARTRSTPLGRASRHEFVEEHSPKSIGPARIHQVICWKSAMLLKIGTVFPDRETGELRESFVEVFVTIVDQNSSHCVASDAMRGNMQRVIVSGKGQSGLAGLKLFKGGYQAVLDSVQSSLSTFNNVNMQVVCPECLARGNPRRASTWSWDEVLAAAEERRESTIVCRRGHRVKSNLLCGTCKEEEVFPVDQGGASKPVTEILPSVVLIGLWDPKIKRIRSVGSGFVADKKFGLVVTAGHVRTPFDVVACCTVVLV